MDLILDRLYGHRQWPSAFSAAAVLALAVLIATRPIAPPRQPDIKPPVAVTLAPPVDTPKPPEPPKPEPPKPEPPRPEPPKPAPPRPSTPQPPTPAPVEAATAAPSAVSAPPAPATPPAPPVEAPPPPPAPAAAKPNAEADYVAKVRSYLNSVKRYPTGREASLQKPRGTARIWFVLARNGELKDADIEQSSDSILLDRAALSSVKRASYQPFPDEAWPGEAQHRFTVDMDYIPGG